MWRKEKIHPIVSSAQRQKDMSMRKTTIVPWNSSDPICKEENKDDWPSRQVFRIVLPWLVFSCLLLSCLILSCLILSCLLLSCLCLLAWLGLSCACRPPPEVLTRHLSVAQGSCSIVWATRWVRVCCILLYVCLIWYHCNSYQWGKHTHTSNSISNCLSFVCAIASFICTGFWAGSHRKSSHHGLGGVWRLPLSLIISVRSDCCGCCCDCCGCLYLS